MLRMQPKGSHRLFLLFAMLTVLSCVAAGAAASSSAPPAKDPYALFTKAQTEELKVFSRMIYDGAREDKILKEWRSYLKKSPSFDLEAALAIVEKEARAVAGKELASAGRRVELYKTLQTALKKEIADAKKHLAGANGKISWPSKSFAVTGDEVAIRRGRLLTQATDLQAYIQDLQRQLDKAVGAQAEAETGFKETEQKGTQLDAIMAGIIKTMRDEAAVVNRAMD